MRVFFEDFALTNIYIHFKFLVFKGGAMVKKIGGFILAVVLVLGILFLVKADVNHGHGPGHHGSESEHGETTEQHH